MVGIMMIHCGDSRTEEVKEREDGFSIGDTTLSILRIIL